MDKYKGKYEFLKGLSDEQMKRMADSVRDSIRDRKAEEKRKQWKIVDGKKGK